MSLNKTLDRLFDEIRREAKRNPAFADRLDAVMRAHGSRRDVAEEVQQDVESAGAVFSPASGGGASDVSGGGKSGKRRAAPPQSAAPTAPPQAGEQTVTINPAGVYKKDGEAALASALASQDLISLRALVAEHNLDPSGVTPSLTRDELAAHILAQAKKRAERDEKMFDY